METISGIVVHGDGYGRKLGFPTANLEKKSENVKSGVYAGKTEFEGKEYRSGILIGPDGKVESHLIGFDGDLYGKTIILTLEKFLRVYKKFDTEEELIAQIKKDISQC